MSVGPDMDTKITEVVLLEKQLSETRACTLSVDTICKVIPMCNSIQVFRHGSIFEICFKFLGPSISCLQYWRSQNALKQHERKCGAQKNYHIEFSQQGLASCRILEEDLADVLVSVHLLLPGYLFYG